MPWLEVRKNIEINGFADSNTIVNQVKSLYQKSPTFREMVDTHIAEGKGLHIEFERGEAKAARPLGTGKIVIDPAYINERYYIDNNGNSVKWQLEAFIAHELVHAIKELKDPRNLSDYNSTDYAGDTVRFANKIFEEMNIPKQNSYVSQSDNVGLIPGFAYTGGVQIDRSVQSGMWDLSHAGVSNDLLIGHPNVGSKLKSGRGDDFLFGSGGNDVLNGGPGFDTAVYAGAAEDYKIRESYWGWGRTVTVEHVSEGNADGTDTLRSIEIIRFSDGVEDLRNLLRSMLGTKPPAPGPATQTGEKADESGEQPGNATSPIEEDEGREESPPSPARQDLGGDTPSDEKPVDDEVEEEIVIDLPPPPPVPDPPTSPPPGFEEPEPTPKPLPGPTPEPPDTRQDLGGNAPSDRMLEPLEPTPMPGPTPTPPPEDEGEDEFDLGDLPPPPPMPPPPPPSFDPPEPAPEPMEEVDEVDEEPEPEPEPEEETEEFEVAADPDPVEEADVPEPEEELAEPLSMFVELTGSAEPAPEPSCAPDEDACAMAAADAVDWGEAPVFDALVA